MERLKLKEPLYGSESALTRCADEVCHRVGRARATTYAVFKDDGIIQAEVEELESVAKSQLNTGYILKKCILLLMLACSPVTLDCICAFVAAFMHEPPEVTPGGQASPVKLRAALGAPE